MVECILRDIEGLDGGNLLWVDVPAAQVEAFYSGESSVVEGTIAGGPGRQLWEHVKYTVLEMNGTAYTVKEAVPENNGTAVRITLGDEISTSSATFA